MTRDFAERYSSVKNKKQQVASRIPAGGGKTGKNRWLWQASGVVLTTAAILGIAGSLWFGRLISSGLVELALEQKQVQELQHLGNTLHQQRSQLLVEEKIKRAARGMGLFPPAASQIQRP